ncbi:HAMP domain-containing sensor histidine kinase [Acinetobacter pittii]|uniref:sensor histidine kinase n=1 Tax=Acinetobacter pittii TaxID=48296 RepID=UPI00280C7677|nr:HAMP domain-containing sensor histidine kinase [Acinetobacter pittii]MDQ9034981.1 HAMP domain-containing sensor histidine kinase [Acinetobacter pittii]MDQ9079954.1 HAMP domain-containing sensor histidine kinase [Acinetobacter pittii]
MNIQELINDLNMRSPEDQIQAIHSFLEKASFDEIQEIKKHLYTVKQPWLKNTLNIYLDLFDHEENIDLFRTSSTKENENNSVKKELDYSADYDIAYNVDEIRSQAVAESIGQIIHELDPLIGSLEIVATREVNNYENSRVKSEINRLQELVDTFTAWKKSQETPNYQNLIIYDIVVDEVDRIKQKENSTFIVNIPHDLDFEVDNFMLRTILSNSLRNAIESHKSVLDRVASLIVVNAGTLENKNLWISIIDEGIGLPKNQTKLFKSQYTTKPGSRGFGLTIVAKSIKSMKGTWDLKNSFPYGATFYFEIPRRSGEE